MAPYFKGWALRVEEEGFRNRSEETVIWAEGSGGRRERISFLREGWLDSSAGTGICPVSLTPLALV